MKSFDVVIYRIYMYAQMTSPSHTHTHTHTHTTHADMTHGWWGITDGRIVDSLLRLLCVR